MACHLRLLTEENDNEPFFSFFSIHWMCSLSQHLCYIKKKYVLMVGIFDIFPFGLSTAHLKTVRKSIVLKNLSLYLNLKSTLPAMSYIIFRKDFFFPTLIFISSI
jgi:hypothetical protein